MARLRSIFLVFLILASGLFISSWNRPLKSMPSDSKSITTNSFHINYTGQHQWMVIKIEVPENMTVKIDYSHVISMNNSTFSFIYKNITWNSWPLYEGLSTFYYGMNPDYYIQLKNGMINWSYNTNHSGEYDWWTERWNWTLVAPGQYTFTLITYSHLTMINTWINVSKNATFTQVNGSEVFVYDRNDFTGKFNIGTPNGTFLFQGEKKILIKNNLIAWIYPFSDFTKGWKKIAYQTPSGRQEYTMIFGLKKKILYSNSSAHFNDSLIWGESGTWTFNANIWARKGLPNIYLFGADLKRP